jgi:hypothetical protein
MNDKLRKALEEIGEDIIDELSRELIKAKKIDTGDLLASLDYRVLETVDGLLLEILANDTLKYVDQGRRRGAKQPPTSAIIPWVERKNIKIKGAKTVEQKAFVIARSIKKNGIRPLNIVNKTRDNILRNKIEILKKASMQDIEIMITDLIKNR